MTEAPVHYRVVRWVLIAAVIGTLVAAALLAPWSEMRTLLDVDLLDRVVPF
jgi:hypothetical protein